MVKRRILAAVLLLALPLFALSFDIAQHNVMVGSHQGAEMSALGVRGGWALVFDVAAVLTCAAFTGPAAIGCGLLAVA